MEIKTCNRCKEIKPLEDFNNYYKGKFGKDYRCRVCAREHFSEYSHSEKGKKYFREKYHRDRKNFPKQVIARKKVSSAVYYGTLSKYPCEVCGDKKSQGHHEDYDKPLEVNWLCDSHHKELHLKQAFYVGAG